MFNLKKVVTWFYLLISYHLILEYYHLIYNSITWFTISSPDFKIATAISEFLWVWPQSTKNKMASEKFKMFQIQKFLP